MAKTQHPERKREESPDLDFRWDDLRVFLALYRGRTLASAAARLKVDATTVGRRLGSLEAALGATLFDRTRDGVSPTPAAEQLLAAAERTEIEATDLFASARAFEREPKGLVRVTTPPVLAEVLVVPLVPELRARHPKLLVELDVSTSVVDLARRQADLAIRLRKPESGDLRVTKLAESAYVIAGSAARAEAIGTLADLDTTPWIGWSAELSGIPAARWMRTHVRSRESVVLTSASMVTQIAAVKQDVGVALLPASIAKLNGLHAIKTKGEARAALEAAPAETVWLASHRSLRDLPRVAAVWDLLVARGPALMTAR